MCATHLLCGIAHKLPFSSGCGAPAYQVSCSFVSSQAKCAGNDPEAAFVIATACCSKALCAAAQNCCAAAGSRQPMQFRGLERHAGDAAREACVADRKALFTAWAAHQDCQPLEGLARGGSVRYCCLHAHLKLQQQCRCSAASLAPDSLHHNQHSNAVEQRFYGVFV